MLSVPTPTRRYEGQCQQAIKVAAYLTQPNGRALEDGGPSLPSRPQAFLEIREDRPRHGNLMHRVVMEPKNKKEIFLIIDVPRASYALCTQPCFVILHCGAPTSFHLNGRSFS